MGIIPPPGDETARSPVKRRFFLFRIATLLFGLILATIAAEIALRAFPEALLGVDLTSALYDPYNTTPLGMYFREPQARMNVMWPSLELKAYSHGYFWTHRTDARGFRNPMDRRATEILLFGDSVIYGHGVEDDQTVTSFLHRDYGYPVYNMARQGDCLYEHYRLIRLYLDELSPRTVLLFAFSNDLVDLAKTDAFARMDHLPEIEGYDYAAIRRSIEQRGRNRPSAPFHSQFLLGRLAAVRENPDGEKPRRGAKGRRPSALLLDLQSRGVLPQDVKTLDLGQAKQIVSIDRVRDRLEGGWRGLDAADLAPAEQYYLQILRDLRDRCREKGTRLVLVNLALDQGEYWRADVDKTLAKIERRIDLAVTPEAEKYLAGFMYDARVKMAAQVGSVLAEVAREDQIDYLDLSALFTAGDNYLENDGHLSAIGHRRLADLLHGYLSRKQVTARTGSR